MKVKKIIIKVLLGIFICFFVFIAIGISIKKMTSKKKYMPLNNIVDYELMGNIDRMRHYHYDKYFGYYIGLSNDSTYMYKITELDALNKNSITNDILKKGDSIYKKKGSRKVKIYRKGKLFREFSLKE